MRGLRFEIMGERGITTKFENQLSIKKIEPTPSDTVRLVTSYNFRKA